ncbi:MAG TPA: JAB domain-containing protein [Candidatus Saccharimonadales bacterium]|nr:JAB domain-containing protein [Candidatus Saccharimonadales bacterium]
MGQRQQEALLKAADILPLLGDIACHRQEHFIVLSVDSGRRLITKRIVFIGTIDAVIAHPREVYAGAVSDFAMGVIVAHNHPSGDPTPSKQDIATTQQLIAAGQILGVTLLDHVIVAGQEYYSFAANGMMLEAITHG